MMQRPPPRDVLPPPPPTKRTTTEEDEEDAFDYDQYSRTDNESDGEGEGGMYSASRSIPGAYHHQHQRRQQEFVYEPETRGAPDLSYRTTSTVDSPRSGGSGRNSGYVVPDGVRIRGGEESAGPSPVDVAVGMGDKSWDELGRNRVRSAAVGSGMYGMAPAPTTGSGSGSASASGSGSPSASSSPRYPSRPPLTLRTSSFSKPSSGEDILSPLARDRANTLSSITSHSSASHSHEREPEREREQDHAPYTSDTSRRNSLHRSVLDRISHQQFADIGGFVPRQGGGGGERWMDTDLDSDADAVSPIDGGRPAKRSYSGRYRAPVVGTEWSHRYYGDTSFTSETDGEGHAVGLVEDGKSRIIDDARVGGWGGVTRLTERLRCEMEGQFDGGVIEEFDGATHLLLANVGLGEQVIDLLTVLLPVVASTLVVLDVSNNLLLDLPPALARCHQLEELNVSENPIVVIPPWTGELTSLRMLMADGCGLKTLPVEMVKARLLHTICVRRNRMINLPSWLSQLYKLETLLVDENPFAGYWQQMIDAILVKPKHHDIPPVPPLPSQFLRRPSDGLSVSSPSLRSPGLESPYPTSSNPSLSSFHSPRMLAASISPSPSLPAHGPYHFDASRHASEVTLSPNQTNTHSASSSGYFSPTSSAAAPDSGRSPDHPVRQEPSVPSRKPSKALKRMRSAGALLGLSSMVEQGYGQHALPSHGTMETLASKPRQYGSGRGGKALAGTTYDGDASSDEDAVPRRAAAATSTANDKPPNKTGKWGFLKKMSMSKMRGTTLSSSRPPLPGHSSSDPAKLQKRNPTRPGADKSAQSALTLPTMRRMPESLEVNEFGVTQMRDPQGDSGVISATAPVKSNTRIKRRSFLPILDAPPSLNIPIPSVSPFDATLVTFTNSPSLARRALPVGDDPPGRASLETRLEGPRGRTYEIGLKSIMSYLRDLYDLSLPIPVINTGAEVVHSDASGASGSMSANSEPRSASPAMANGRGPLAGRRSRRPTIVADVTDTDDFHSGNQSPLSVGDEINAKLQGLSLARPDSVAREAPEEPVHQKTYKDDSVVRTGVIKHILDTERSYVQGLRDLVDIYVNPASLPVRGSNETVIPQTERKIVFGGIEGILQFHEVSFLPTLETAAKELLRNGDDVTGDRSKRVAREIGEAFRIYHPFMRQYSTYINNFDFALSRLSSWTTAYEKLGLGAGMSGSGPSAMAAATIGVGLGISAIANSPLESGNGSQLTPAQRKRVKHFMKACRKNPKHTQISLESYLLLPVQRIPRYRMLLDDLARSTPPAIDVQLDPIEEALEEMVALASTMNEEKRDAESRQRLVKWQSRIRGRFASPLVQAHRRLLLDGTLLLTRIVKRSSTFVEVSSSLVDDNGNNENTITNAKTIVQIETLAPEVPNRQLAAIVTSDLMILCKDPAMGKDPNSQLDLYAVLKMQTKRKPATLLQGNGIRLVDNKAILYLSASSTQEAANWVRIINNEFDPLR